MTDEQIQRQKHAISKLQSKRIIELTAIVDRIGKPDINCMPVAWSCNRCNATYWMSNIPNTPKVILPPRREHLISNCDGSFIMLYDKYSRDHDSKYKLEIKAKNIMLEDAHEQLGTLQARSFNHRSDIGSARSRLGIALKSNDYLIAKDNIFSNLSLFDILLYRLGYRVDVDKAVGVEFSRLNILRKNKK